MDNTRRGFLRGLAGAAAGAAASVGAVATERKVIVEEVVERRAVYEDVMVTSGDGSRDGDTAMIKVGGNYRAHVRTDGRWRRVFAG